MARRIGSMCRLCRREGIKLFIKGTRCVSAKCSFDKRSYSPGQHGQRRRTKVSDYGMQLREKQKVKRIYGILEKQFRGYFQKSERQKGVTGEILLQMLERRLDNVVFRSCFAASRAQARQIVKHNGIAVNGSKVNIPSYLIKKDDVISMNIKDENKKKIEENIKVNKDRGLPKWINLDEAKFSATVLDLPDRDDVGFPIEEQLIVELYSK
ncbi:MAG: 30S ribosomal protein S4 [Candidatus Orphnella occulta]|nr:30S ribosomal protein S4 [Candidatus Orphnella occulta]MDP8296893.1 30S ribosomal protein S4 [Candidatus Orphnella occulta]